jgi:hypothetical protein
LPELQPPPAPPPPVPFVHWKVEVLQVCEVSVQSTQALPAVPQVVLWPLLGETTHWFAWLQQPAQFAGEHCPLPPPVPLLTHAPNEQLCDARQVTQASPLVPQPLDVFPAMQIPLEVQQPAQLDALQEPEPPPVPAVPPPVPEIGTQLPSVQVASAPQSLQSVPLSPHEAWAEPSRHMPVASQQPPQLVMPHGGLLPHDAATARAVRRAKKERVTAEAWRTGA